MENMKLKEVFEDRADKPFVFIKQGGNQGDSMIYAGARKLADKTGLEYREIGMGRKAKNLNIEKNEIIYLNGGGGFNTWWNWTPRLLHQLTKKYPNNLIIVGPSTVALQEWYLKKWLPKDRNIIFFARELTTYKYLKENFYPGVHIDHDTAMHLRPGDGYLEKVKGTHTPALLWNVCLLREDPESTNEIPDQIKDLIDKEYFQYIIDPCQTAIWPQLHVKAKNIYTNRSHSAILGSLLDKPTYMFAGAYHKNRSIWAYSLKDRGVKWIEE